MTRINITKFESVSEEGWGFTGEKKEDFFAVGVLSRRPDTDWHACFNPLAKSGKYTRPEIEGSCIRLRLPGGSNYTEDDIVQAREILISIVDETNDKYEKSIEQKQENEKKEKARQEEIRKKRVEIEEILNREFSKNRGD